MAKTRVGVLFRETMGGNKSTNKSSDLTALTQRYHAFAKKIRALVEALKAQHESMLKMEATRQQVRRIVSCIVCRCCCRHADRVLPILTASFRS